MIVDYVPFAFVTWRNERTLKASCCAEQRAGLVYTKLAMHIIILLAQSD